jgi:hypothetical protein
MTKIAIEALKTSYKSLESKSMSIDTFKQGFLDNPEAGILDIYEGGTPSAPQAVALWGGFIAARLNMETKDVVKHSTVLAKMWKEVNDHITSKGVATVITRINELQRGIDNTPIDYDAVRKTAFAGLEKNAKALRDCGTTSNTEIGKVKDIINTLLRSIDLPSLDSMEHTLETV